MNYICSIIFIFACFVFAFYNKYSIKGETNNWVWHLLQWFSVLLFLCSGIFFGVWLNDFNFHDFGKIIGIAVISIPVYVETLHYLLRKRK